MIPTKNFRKLNDFVSKHQSLVAQFQVHQTTQEKFRVLKHTINLLNPQSVKSVSIKNSIKNDCNELAQQSEQMYFRQLNKMCEGQQQFQLNKIEEINKKHRLIKEEQAIKHRQKQAKSAHGYRKKLNYFKSKEQEDKNQNSRKFLQLPNFADILAGCSVAYAGMSTEALLKRKMKAFKQSITKSRGFNSKNENNQSTHKNANKSSHLRQQIKELKKKAKNQYNLEFQDFNIENGDQQLVFRDQNQQKVKSESLSFFGYSGKIKKENNYLKPVQQQLNKRISVKRQQSFHIPIQLMKVKNKFRPSTVSTNIFRLQKSQQEKFNYFRV